MSISEFEIFNVQTSGDTDAIRTRVLTPTERSGQESTSHRPMSRRMLRERLEAARELVRYLESQLDDVKGTSPGA